MEEAELAGGKGIGPTYSTKMSRSGVRIADIFREDFFENKVRTMAVSFKKRFGDLLQYDVEEELARFKARISTPLFLLSSLTQFRNTEA